MTSLSLAGIPGDLLKRYSHREISHCLKVNESQSVFRLNTIEEFFAADNNSENFDLAMLNLAVMPSIVSCLNQLVQHLKPSGYFGLIFFHWPSMQNWFVYELQSNLFEVDQRKWEEGCRSLDQFLDEGKIQVVEREVIRVSPDFLENTDLIGLFEQHRGSFSDSFDDLVLGKVKNTLLNLEGFLESSNSNLDLYIESIFGVREW